MTDAIAVVNAGSSSLKFSVMAARDGRVLLKGQVEALRMQSASPSSVHAHARVHGAGGQVVLEKHWPSERPLSHEDAVAFMLTALREHLGAHTIRAVGHRVVHGGTHHSQPVVLDDAVLAALHDLIPLAPLHQPHNLAPVAALAKLAPDLPQVACFDTAFHASNPPVAQAFALPRELHEAGVRRYGFHGLSYEYIASCLPAVSERAAQGRVVALHLGNGASMCAMQGGVSVASTMGFTALDGLPMGTRCGAIDAGVVLWLMDQRGMGAREIETLLYQRSGLLGVSGESSDMRQLLESQTEGARRAIDLFVYRIAREMGSLAAALGGLDAIVFTAGIGEHAQEIRARVGRAAAWLGVRVDESANAQAQAQAARIDAPGSAVEVWVIPTDEEAMIARHTRALVLGGPG